MLYEQQLRMLAKALFYAFNGMLDESNMSINSGDYIKQLIFFKRLFPHINEQQTEAELRKNIEIFLDNNKVFKDYFIRELNQSQSALNFIAYNQYYSWRKKQRNKEK